MAILTLDSVILVSGIVISSSFYFVNQANKKAFESTQLAAIADNKASAAKKRNKKLRKKQTNKLARQRVQVY